MSDAVILTTTPEVPGREVLEIIDIVTAESVQGMNIIKDVFASVTDIFGGRSSTTENVLIDARNDCLRELRQRAAAMGADAVIGVDLDYSEFSGGGGMLFLVASGTAVKLK
ncbi:MAG: YbjQ family protein [Pseudomonadota bacterium]